MPSEATLTMPETTTMPKLSDVTAKFLSDLVAGVLASSVDDSNTKNSDGFRGTPGTGWR